MQNEADLVMAWSGRLGSGSGFYRGRLEKSISSPKVVTSAECCPLIRDNCPHLRDGPEAQAHQCSELGNKGVKS